MISKCKHIIIIHIFVDDIKGDVCKDRIDVLIVHTLFCKNNVSFISIFNSIFLLLKLLFQKNQDEHNEKTENLDNIREKGFHL